EALLAGTADDPEPALAVDAEDPGVLAVDAVQVARAVEGERFGASLRKRRSGLDVSGGPRLPRSSAAPGGGECEEQGGGRGSQRSLDPDGDHRLRLRLQPAQQPEELALGQADAAGSRVPCAHMEKDRRPATRYDWVRVVLDHREVAVLRRDTPERLAAAAERRPR